MYRIRTKPNHLLVEFHEDFDFNVIRSIIHHETQMKEYFCMDDIWLIGNHRALISLDDLETMVQEFRCSCPRNAERKKTALVVDEGLTEAILELWVKETRNRVPFEIRIFHTLEESEAWLGVANKKVA